MSSHFLAPVVAMTAARLDDTSAAGDRASLRAALTCICQADSEADLVWNAAICLRRWRRDGRKASASAALAAHLRDGAGELRPNRWIVALDRGHGFFDHLRCRLALDPRRMPGGQVRPPARSCAQRYGRGASEEVEA